MTQTADVVVLGAGIAGASTAFFAAAAGLKVIVVETSLPGAGASGRTAGYIRCHYANPHEAYFAYEGWKIHMNWAEIVGGDNGYRQIGFLFIVPPALMAPLAKNVDLLTGLGVNTLVVDPMDLKALQPFMEAEGIGGAAYEPESGYADPSDCIGSLLAGVRRRGGQVILEAGPTRLRTTGSRIAGVQAGAESLSAPNVVLAAGAATRELAAPIGVELPVFPMPIGAGLLHHSAAASAMCVIDHAAEQWYRGELGGAVLIGAGYEDSIGFKGEPFHGKAEFTPPTRDELVAAATRLLPRIPDLEHAVPGTTWVGLDSRTPDGHALAGPVPAVPGLYLLTGGNGKGFKFGPSMGRALAQIVAGERFEDSPLAPFALDRFDTGRVIRGEHEYAWGSFA
ncbi:MAG: NAD(P)/FAD-dependent oxidoreductase [Candidatus Rokuibacteriota bacterium]